VFLCSISTSPYSQELTSQELTSLYYITVHEEVIPRYSKTLVIAILLGYTETIDITSINFTIGWYWLGYRGKPVCTLIMRKHRTKQYLATTDIAITTDHNIPNIVSTSRLRFIVQHTCHTAENLRHRALSNKRTE